MTSSDGDLQDRQEQLVDGSNARACEHGGSYREGDHRVCVECGARFPEDRLLRSCERCQKAEPEVTLSVCCSSHGKTLCHRDYRLTHFVEVCGCSRCEAEGLPRIYPPKDRDEIAEWIEAGNPRRKRTAGVMSIWDEIHAERVRAHEKHRATSMESMPWLDPDGARRDIITEEVGEVAKEFNEARHEGREVDAQRLRKELIQVAAMTAAWAAAIPNGEGCG